MRLTFKQKVTGLAIAIPLGIAALDIVPGIVQFPFVKRDCMPPSTAFANNVGSLVFLATGPQVDVKIRDRAMAEEWAREKHYEMTVTLPERNKGCYWLPGNYLVSMAQSHWGKPTQAP
ncbi:MAG: hypothetical protein EBQ96_09515 [Proteobacteria bacterium]|nr:hypothetical protein [Pseudomonadota bacterium]